MRRIMVGRRPAPTGMRERVARALEVVVVALPLVAVRGGKLLELPLPLLLLVPRRWLRPALLVPAVRLSLRLWPPPRRCLLLPIGVVALGCLPCSPALISTFIERTTAHHEVPHHPRVLFPCVIVGGCARRAGRRLHCERPRLASSTDHLVMMGLLRIASLGVVRWRISGGVVWRRHAEGAQILSVLGGKATHAETIALSIVARDTAMVVPG